MRLIQMGAKWIASTASFLLSGRIRLVVHQIVVIIPHLPSLSPYSPSNDRESAKQDCTTNSTNNPTDDILA